MPKESNTETAVKWKLCYYQQNNKFNNNDIIKIFIFNIIKIL